MTKLSDLSDSRFGRWLVVRRAPPRAWICRCDCGTEREVDGGSLRSGRSNGCLGCHPGRGNRRTHGGRDTRLYTIWTRMKGRCENPNDPAFDRYGGRGVTICRAWASDFMTFRSWAEGAGYRDDLSIDRIDNDLGYTPGNYRWATPTEQNRNRRDNRRVEYRGEMLLASELAERHGLPADVVKNRIWRYGWDVARAVSTPVAPKAKALTFTVAQRNIDA